MKINSEQFAKFDLLAVDKIYYRGVQTPFPLLTNTLKAYVPYSTDEQEQFAKFDLLAVDEIYCTNTKIYCINTISFPNKYSYQPICTISRG